MEQGKASRQKAPLKLRDIWAIRVRLQLGRRTRDLALFNLAIDSKLRACDLVKLWVADVANGGTISSRAVVLQQKTGRPVQFEITQLTRESLTAWIAAAALRLGDYLSRRGCTPRPTSRRGSTPESSTAGSMPSGWRVDPTGRTRCDGLRLR